MQPKINIMITRLIFVMLASFACNSFAAKQHTHAPSLEIPTTRTLALSDLGISEPVSLGNRNHEQHFFLPVPQGIALKNARLEIHGTYLHPFPERAALSILVNGVAVFTQSLSDREGGFSLKLAYLNNEYSTNRNNPDSGLSKEIDLSLPLKNLKSQEGFLDLGVVFSTQVDVTGCMDERGRGSELSISPKATRISYTFDGDSVRDVRTLLTTLPHRPAILLPSRQLTQVQYEAALRLSQAMSGNGLQPEFVTIPQPGDMVSTKDMISTSELDRIPSLRKLLAAARNHADFKIAQADDVGAWLILRMLSPNGLAQAVIDPDQVRKVLAAALRQIPPPDAHHLQKLFGQQLQLDHADQWLNKATLDKASVRVSLLAGQPVLAIDGPDMLKGATLIATMWHKIANGQELALGAIAPLADKGNSSPHVHLPQNLPIRHVSANAEWQIPVRIGELPEGQWPESFELSMMAAPSSDGLSPTASILLNDNLLTATALRTDGKITRISAKIPLYSLRANNILKVEISRRVESGHCSGSSQDTPVQLLPSSYLELGNVQDTTHFYMLESFLAHKSEIAIPFRYLENAEQTLPTVSAILRGLSVGALGFNLSVHAKTSFTPARPFIAFELKPSPSTELASTASGRLIIRNGHDQTVFNSAGLGELAVLQLAHSDKQPGVFVASVTGKLPRFNGPLELSFGNLAVADAQGVKLAVDMDDPDNDFQLDEQNRGVKVFFQRHQVWFVILVILLMAVLTVLAVREYYRHRNLKA